MKLRLIINNLSKDILCVLTWILLLFPIFIIPFLFLSCCFIFRKVFDLIIVQFHVWFRDEVVVPITTPDSTYFLQPLKDTRLYNFICPFEFQGEMLLELEILKLQFSTLVLQRTYNNNNSHNNFTKLTFWKLWYTPISYIGYYYWKKLTSLDLDQIIRIEPELNNGNIGLEEYLASWLEADFHVGGPLWEIVLYHPPTPAHNNKSKSSDITSTSTILIKMNHALGDIKTMKAIMLALCNSLHVPPTTQLNVVVNNNSWLILTKFNQICKCLLRLPFCMYYMIISSSSSSSSHKNNDNIIESDYYVNNYKFRIAFYTIRNGVTRIKSIAHEAKIPFRLVLASVVNSTFIKYLQVQEKCKNNNNNRRRIGVLNTLLALPLPSTTNNSQLDESNLMINSISALIVQHQIINNNTLDDEHPFISWCNTMQKSHLQYKTRLWAGMDTLFYYSPIITYILPTWLTNSLGMTTINIQTGISDVIHRQEEINSSVFDNQFQLSSCVGVHALHNGQGVIPITFGVVSLGSLGTIKCTFTMNQASFPNKESIRKYLSLFENEIQLQSNIGNIIMINDVV